MQPKYLILREDWIYAEFVESGAFITNGAPVDCRKESDPPRNLIPYRNDATYRDVDGRIWSRFSVTRMRRCETRLLPLILQLNQSKWRMKRYLSRSLWQIQQHIQIMSIVSGRFRCQLFYWICVFLIYKGHNTLCADRLRSCIAKTCLLYL